MRIALIQQQATTDLKESVEQGLQALEDAADEGARLAVYPELSFTPFYPQSRARPDALSLAEPIPGPTTELFQDAARHLGIVVVINLYERDGDHAFDASPVIDADGTHLGTTRMMHITDYEHFHERDYYRPGESSTLVYQTAIGKLGVSICYDRHYPEYMRALALAGADLVAVPQAGTVGEWPDGLYEAELQVSSFQNGYFMALANRVGEEGDMMFAGESFVTDPFGRVIARAPSQQDAILYADVDLTECDSSPARRRFLPDRRPEIYEQGILTS